MTDITYFQTYSGKENHLTNNTMLLFKYIYDHKPKKFANIINLITGDKIHVGISIQNQVKSTNSTPDGSISQAGFKILFEAKLTNDTSDTQIKNHLKDEANYLIVLTRDKSKENEDKTIYTTYSEIIEKIRTELKDWDENLNEIVDQYENFCASQKVLSVIKMAVNPCSETIKLNEKNAMYHNCSGGSRAAAKFIGIYDNKKIRFVGEIEAVVLFGDNCKYEYERGVESQELDKRIEQHIEDTRILYKTENWPNAGERFFILKRPLGETNFVKQSRGGLWGLRYFNLSADYEVKPEDDAKAVAEKLNGQTFD